MPSTKKRKRGSQTQQHLDVPNQQQGQAVIDPRLLTIPQAAEYLNSTVWNVRELCWTRQLKHMRLGKRILIPRGALDDFIDRRLADFGQPLVNGN